MRGLRPILHRVSWAKRSLSDSVSEPSSPVMPYIMSQIGFPRLMYPARKHMPRDTDSIFAKVSAEHMAGVMCATVRPYSPSPRTSAEVQSIVRNRAFPTPSETALASAAATMAGDMSTPVAERTLPARARVYLPAPHPMSSMSVPRRSGGVPRRTMDTNGSSSPGTGPSKDRTLRSQSLPSAGRNPPGLHRLPISPGSMQGYMRTADLTGGPRRMVCISVPSILSAMADAEMTAAEIEERIEACRKRIMSAEAAIAERPDSSRAQTLAISVRPLRAELANLERLLDEARAREDPREREIRKELDKNQAEIEELEERLRTASDPVEVNNLSVSRRFLQMERNQLLIRLAGGRGAEEEDETAELRRANDAKSRIIEDQNAKIESLRKELSVAKAALGNPEDSASCDETRVTVTAGRLNSIRNEARRLGAENYDLRTEISDLKKQADLLHRNIGELTAHCRESDGHIRELEERCRALSGQLEASVRKLREAEKEIAGLREYIAGSK